MSYLERALASARKGYFVFPVTPYKVPPKGFTNWEEQATTDEAQIREWWKVHPESLPAVAPGRSGLAVIDVDRHEGKVSGFDSMARHKIFFSDDVFRGNSVSGNGTHFWFRASVYSLNGVLTSVDRKSNGGYVVVSYDLPHASEILTPLPKYLAGRKKDIRQVDNPWKAPLSHWLRTVGHGEISEPMYIVIDYFKRTEAGNSKMSSCVSQVVRLASGQEVTLHYDRPRPRTYSGVPYSGAAKALDVLKDHWMSLPHSSGDPEEEFEANVRSSIRKFGAAPKEEDFAEVFLTALEEEREVAPDSAELFLALIAFCTREYPEWRKSKYCNDVLSRISTTLTAVHTTEDALEWLQKSKEVVKRKFEDE